MSTPKKFETILAGMLALLERDGDGVIVQAEEDGELLVLGGQPIGRPVVAYGPFDRRSYGNGCGSPVLTE
jgi:redox-sensitive bicupin YhaK (pirin superfamily)